MDTKVRRRHVVWHFQKKTAKISKAKTAIRTQFIIIHQMAFCVHQATPPRVCCS